MNPPDQQNPIRILHIFAPSYRHRFTGPVIQWRYHFNHWDDPSIAHSVLDTETTELINGKVVFDFKLTAQQSATPRAARFAWIFALFKGLYTHRGEYDLLHVHVLWWGTLLLGLLPWLKKIPMIYESVLLGEDTPSGLKHEKLGKLKLALLRKYAGILAISEVLAEDYTQHGFPSSKVFSLMNSVDTVLFSPCGSREQKNDLRLRHGINPDDLVYLFVGTVNQRKGADILFQAFAATAEAIPSARLIMVGAANKNENPAVDEGFLQTSLEPLKQKGLEDRLTFAGLVQDRNILADYFRMADAFVFPSRSEGLPTVVLEAMASGLTVIASSLPALRPLILNGVNGMLCPLEDANSFSLAMERVSTNSALRVKIGCTARDYVQMNHNFNAWQKEISRIYRLLFSQRSRND